MVGDPHEDSVKQLTPHTSHLTPHTSHLTFSCNAKLHALALPGDSKKVLQQIFGPALREFRGGGAGREGGAAAATRGSMDWNTVRQ